MWAASEMDRQQLGNSQKMRMMNNEKSLITEFSTPATTKDCPDFSNDPVEGCPRLKGFEP